MAEVLSDIYLAFRSLRRSLGFTALAVLTLSVGIGANVALFSLLDAVLLRSLPFRHGDRLVVIQGHDAERTGTRIPMPLTEALRERSVTIESFSIHNAYGGSLRTSDGPLRIAGQRVSASFFDLLGVSPLAGRGFLPEEEEPGAPAVMVVSFGFWQQQMGGDPEAVGHTLYLDQTPYTVVGIMPPDFQDYLSSRTHFWTPHGSDRIHEVEREIGHELWGRLAPGVTQEEASLELQSISEAVGVEEWRQAGRRIGITAFKDEVVGDSAYALQLLLAAVTIVLAIACANLAQLLLARSDRRVSEFATRKALGAPTQRLLRLALTESLLLSTAGGVGGVALAYLLLPVLVALAPTEIPRINEAVIDGRVLSPAIGLSLLTGCTFGLAPALRLARLSVVEAMKRASQNHSADRATKRHALVAGQVACSVVLLVLAGLVLQTFLALLPSDPGFKAESRTVLPLYLRPDLYPDRGDRVRRWEDLAARIEGLPGVDAAGFGENVPFGSDDGFRPMIDLTQEDVIDGAAELMADRRAVSSNYFQLLQMPLISGRIFTAADRAESTGVAIVNETLARKLDPRGAVLGRRIRVRGAPLQAYEIVGVVANARSAGTSTEAWDEVYIPHAQSGADFGFLIVQSKLRSGTLDEMLRAEVRSWAPELPYTAWTTAMSMEDMLYRSVAGPRFSATLTAAFSGVALLLATVGIFGMVAYSVSQRTRELGVRAALGARPGVLLTTAIRPALALTALGVGLGLAVAIYLVRFLENQLYGVAAFDVSTFLGAGSVMFLAAGLAAYVPACRAARTNPMTALRHE